MARVVAGLLDVLDDTEFRQPTDAESYFLAEAIAMAIAGRCYEGLAAAERAARFAHSGASLKPEVQYDELHRVDGLQTRLSWLISLGGSDDDQ